jgi:DNA-binding protein HU-beta
MNKGHIVKELSEKHNIPKVAANGLIDDMINIIKNGLREGDKVSIQGFGVFSVKDVAERAAINPKTLAKIKVPAKKRIKFKAANGLKEKFV